MKHLKQTVMAAALAFGGFVAGAETVENYVLDFNTPIETPTGFACASNWQHLVGTYESNSRYGNEVTYRYEASEGVDGTGCLKVGYQTEDDYTPAYDLLITPKVNGKITISAKKASTSYSADPFIEIYSLNASGKKDKSLGKLSSSALSMSEYKPLEVTLESTQRVGIYAQNVYIDNFTAESAEIGAEPKLSFVSAATVDAFSDTSNGGTSGAIKWSQSPDGSVTLKWSVVVTNNGELDLTPGMENYSVSIYNYHNDAVLGTTNVPVALAVGETSEPFEVTAVVSKDDLTSVWSYTSQTRGLYLKENITGNVQKAAYSGYVAYESKFCFRVDGNTGTSVYKDPIDLGKSTEVKSVTYQIYNDGVAPLTVKSVKFPAGFVCTADPELAEDGGCVVASKGVQNFTFAFDPENVGTFNDTFELVYVDNKGADVTHKNDVKGSYLTPGTWFADFNNTTSTIVVPDGAAMEAGVDTYNSSAYTYVSGMYDYHLKSYYNNSAYENAGNKFITPKLHANAGDTFVYTVWQDSQSSSTNLKVYVSTDRVNWGEPVEVVLPGDFEEYEQRLNKTIDFAEEGDYYIAFANYGMYVDDLIGLTKVDVDKDLYITKFTQTEKCKKGENVSVDVEFIPLTDLNAADYTVEYWLGGEKVAEATSVDAVKHYKNTKSFSIKYVPEIEQTTTLTGYVVVRLADGTEFKTKELQVTIENEPMFNFIELSNNPGQYWNPADYKTAITFGKVNEANLVKSYKVWNHGTAPLTLKSVTMPEGFSTDFDTENPLEGKSGRQFNVIFSAETPGSYAGELEIVYVNAAGEDVTYKHSVSGVMLDTTKWYVNFDTPSYSDSAVWPAGTVYQSNVSITETGDYSAPNKALYTSSGETSKDRMFITPKLHAEAGEKLQFDAKLYGSNWSEGGVKVYTAATREELADPESTTRTLLATVGGKEEDEANKATVDYKTFEVVIPEAGDYYIGFDLYSRLYVDEIYGLNVVPVGADLQLADSSVQTEGMQNILAAGSLSVRNFGIEDVEANSYKVTVYVDGVANEVAETPVIPMMHKFTETAVSVPVSFRSPKAGTYPVYVELSMGNFKLTTEPVDVTFAEETLSSEVTVGEYSSMDQKPVNIYYKMSQYVGLFTPAELGLNAGDKVSSIVIKGFGKKDFKTNFQLAYQWTDESTLAKPSTFDVADMTEYYNGEYNWINTGSDKVLADQIVINFAEPVVYEGGKSLKIAMYSQWPSCTSSGDYKCEVTNNNANSYGRYNDTNIDSPQFSAWVKPVLHISLVADATTLSGKVEHNDGSAVENGVVTLVSADGDNVQYTANVAEDGTYLVNVIQSGRVYDVTAADGAKVDIVDGVSFADGNQSVDFVLYDFAHLHDAVTGIENLDNALVRVALDVEPGVNALALPITLSDAEVKSIFGDECQVYEFGATKFDGGVATAYFVPAAKIEAGVPYLVLSEEPAKAVTLRGKTVKAEGSMIKKGVLNLTSSYSEVSAEGKTTIGAHNFDGHAGSSMSAIYMANGESEATTAEVIKPFRAYFVTADNANVTDIRVMTASDLTSLSEIASDLDNHEIYNLQGLRVKNPTTGIYVVDGKVTVLK